MSTQAWKPCINNSVRVHSPKLSAFFVVILTALTSNSGGNVNFCVHTLNGDLKKGFLYFLRFMRNSRVISRNLLKVLLLTVNSPVIASKPTWTVCSKFVGYEIFGLSEPSLLFFTLDLTLSIFFFSDSGSFGRGRRSTGTTGRASFLHPVTASISKTSKWPQTGVWLPIAGQTNRRCRRFILFITHIGILQQIKNNCKSNEERIEPLGNKNWSNCLLKITTIISVKDPNEQLQIQ